MGRLDITLTQADGLSPLTHYNFEVRGKINETAGQWQGLVQYVGRFVNYILLLLFYTNLFSYPCITKEGTLGVYQVYILSIFILCRVDLSYARMLQEPTMHLTETHISILQS